MSYEIDKVNKIKCACGKSFIKTIRKSNDWGQIKEDIFIECFECNQKYKIESKVFTPKPKHDYTIYYLVDKNSGAKIKLDI